MDGMKVLTAAFLVVSIPVLVGLVTWLHVTRPRRDRDEPGR
jgi:hypothetical protein